MKLLKLTKGKDLVRVEPGSPAEERWRSMGFLAEGEAPPGREGAATGPGPGEKAPAQPVAKTTSGEPAAKKPARRRAAKKAKKE